ncbi:MAG: DUF2062 domain-containing protein [Gammaproteobacteria bacterium]|nr:DUF2062 domain-containing protein [Gammaproteobacteria bacterium]
MTLAQTSKELDAMNWRRFIPTQESLMNNRWLKWLTPWLAHPKLWHWSRRGVALGVALGVFFGLLIPIAQIPITAAAAVILRANLPVAAASTLVTNPVTFAPVYYGAYQLGSWVTGDTTPLVDFETIEQPSETEVEKGFFESIQALGKPLLVGLSIIASISGVLTYFIIDFLWRWRTGSRWKKRNGSD